MMSTIAGRYRLLAELGRGGMANVYLALTESPGARFAKLVVIKQLREHLARDPEFVTMFLDEARLAARLNHPNVVQTLDSGTHGGEPFLAMEYLDGQPYHRILNRAVSRPDAFGTSFELAVLGDVLAGLEYAHTLVDFDGSALNVVHRDVTPHNVFVTYDGQVKVVDFGIARAEGRRSQTRHGIIKGKIAYMAPEQARAENVDARADVFAVGVMLFEALSGTRMWLDETDKSILKRLISGDVPRSPSERTKGIPPALDAICRRALAPNPDERYPSARAMQQDLDSVVDDSLGRASARKLGGAVTELFADRRELTRRLIESQLSHLRSEQNVDIVALPTDSGDVHRAATARSPVGETRISAPDTMLLAATSGEQEQLVTAPFPSPAFPPPAFPAIASHAPVSADVTPSSLPARPRARSWIVVAAAAALGTLALATTVVVGTTRVASAPARTVRIVLQATPADAHFRIDEGPDLPNPYRGTIVADDRDHRVVAVAPGHAASEQQLRFDDDVSLRVVLTRH